MLAVAVGVGAVAAIAATVLVQDRIPADFFAVAAQVLPVFLVALAIEQRLSDRLGKTEDQYVRDAEWALGQAADALFLYESGDKNEATRLMDSVSARRDVGWAADYAEDAVNSDPDNPPDVAQMARERYRQRRSGEIALVLVIIGIIVAGEAAALVGLIQGGTSSDCVWFVVTAGTLVTTVVAVTLASFRELIFYP